MIITSTQLYMVFTIIWNRQQLHNTMANRTPLPPKSTYNYIVVGAGSAGAIVACRLSQWGADVVLLEAGGSPNALFDDIPALAYTYVELDKQSLRSYQLLPQKYTGHSYANNGTIVNLWGRVLGGSSSVNEMLYNRGNHKYYDTIAAKYGAIGWDYASVLPVFKLMENNTDPGVSDQYHGRSGPISVSTPTQPFAIQLKQAKAALEWGLQTIDINGPNQTGFTIGQSTNARGIRSSTNNAYLESGLCPNLTIVTGAVVEKILISSSSDQHNTPRAQGVVFVKSNRKHRIRANREVIISAGSIASPQLLMLSGVGPKQHLKNKGIGHVFGNIPVGNNYCDQVSVNIDFRLIQPNLAEPMFSLDNISQLYQVTVQGKGLMSEKPNTMMYWSTKYNNDTTYPDIYMYLTVNRKGSEPAISSNAMANSKTLERQIKRYSRQMISNNYVSLGTGLVRPVSCGTIRLNTSSINDQPVIDPNFLANPSDRLRLREAIADTFHFVETTSFGRYVRPSILPMPPCQYCPDVPIYRCNTYIDCLIDNWAGAETHSVGSCRMGDPRRTDTVVDPRLRVKGIHRLRVVDASIYPEIINAATNAAAMLAGEMGARFIHKDNKGYK